MTRPRSPPSHWPRATTRYHALLPVVLGTTLGMLLANLPAVFFGDAIAKRVAMPLVHGIAALVFAVLGLLTLFNVGDWF